MAGQRNIFSFLTILGLIAGLTAACGGGERFPSAPRFDAEAPAVPRGLVADRQDGAVVLRWNANARDADLAGYAVYRSASIEGGYVLVDSAVTTNEWIDPASPDGVAYYRVAAIDAASNQSALSDPAGTAGPELALNAR